MEEVIKLGDLRATEEVLHELERKADDVFEWVKQRRELFVDIDDEIQAVVEEILKDHRKLLDTRKNRSGADPFVVALAKINGCTVVSNERATHSPDRPNIPDVCTALGIRCITILDLIREQGWVFSVGGKT